MGVAMTPAAFLAIQASKTPPIDEERILELIEASEAYPTSIKLVAPGPAYRDVALLLRELLERRKM